METQIEGQPHALGYAFQKAKRCGAKTRIGMPCQSPTVRGRSRCRMHGGAAGSGAPIGNKNALKHGYFSQVAVENRRAQRMLIQCCTNYLYQLEGEFNL